MSSLISKYKLNFQDIQSIDWKTQDASEVSILFYKINENDIDAVEKFEQRIKNVKYKYCVINSKAISGPKYINIQNNEWNDLQKECCDVLYPIQLSEKKTIAITGTNGKTTTTDIIRQILVNEKQSVLTIGTLGVWKNNEHVSDFGLTSPSYIDLRKTLYAHRDVDTYVCEVSSHALDQERFYGISFDAAAWTSFSQDHLDYHRTMDQYFACKVRILKKLKSNSKLFVSYLDENILKKINLDSVALVNNDIEIENPYFKIPYNLKNLSLARKILISLGFDIKNEFEGLRPTPGRFNILNNKEASGKVVIDFAHTPDAIKNICAELKSIYPGQKLIVVFGCGGDRDKTKRPLMAKAASEFADYIYVTSDNPRFEDPLEIINDTAKGILICEFELIEDRASAIKASMNKYPNEIILIAGKGHENYIDQNGTKTFYSDEEEVVKGTSNDQS
jgi:UDP-N-acetylmuramoyl-L-alanyl-D-glutamate--2,6-diaminopimelate ligase